MLLTDFVNELRSSINAATNGAPVTEEPGHVRALLASGVVPRRLSLDGLASYLQFGSVQDPLTIVDGVRSLLPGHYLVIDCKEDGFGVKEVPYANCLLTAGDDGLDSVRGFDRNRTAPRGLRSGPRTEQLHPAVAKKHQVKREQTDRHALVDLKSRFRAGR